MENNPAWNAMNRARNLLSLAHLAAESTAKDSKDDPSGMVAALATIIDIIEGEVDTAMIAVAGMEKGQTLREGEAA
jgi:hypothetical protein